MGNQIELQLNAAPRAAQGYCAPIRLIATVAGRRFFFATILLGVLLMLGACASQPQPSSGNTKEAWLGKNFSSHAKASGAPLTQLPSDTRFRRQILAGQVSNRMTLDDAFAALRMQPYGTQPQQAAYWCENKRVTACSNRCLSCEATLFGQHNIVFLRGSGRNVTVRDMYPKRFEDYRATVDGSALRYAEQIHQHEIVPGMPAGIVQMIINQQHYKADYFCASSPQASSNSCLGRCNLCKIVLTGRSASEGRQSIFLDIKSGQQIVTNVLTQ